MTTRRSFMACILAAGMAPAIGHAGILMPVRKIITKPAYVLSVRQYTLDDLVRIVNDAQRLIMDNAAVRCHSFYGPAVAPLVARL